MAGLLHVSGFLTPLISRVADLIPDPAARAKAQAEAMTEMLGFIQDQDKAQLDVDAAEANNKNVFVAGWRPAIGWACSAAFAWDYVLQPMLAAVSALFNHPINLPELNTSDMMPVLLGMLGLGGLRTFEKVQGVAGKGSH